MDPGSKRNKQIIVSSAVPRHLAQSREPRRQKWAEPKDWTDRIRDAVTQLYIAEDKPLKEVISIMAKEYGHLATKRMYVSRLQTWGLVKNKNESDMNFILYKGQQRLAVGKNTTFVVRGRQVKYEDAYYYFERKGSMPGKTNSRPPTPPHILYRTPSPPPRLHISEELFVSVKAYYDMSYTSGAWDFSNAACVDIRTGESDLTNLTEFHASCQSATNLIESKSFVEARRMLSTGFGFIRSIVEHEHPSTLYYLLESLCRLRQHGLPEIDSIIRSYISKMCSIVHPEPYPWASMWRLLGTVDGNDIGDVLLQCWKCANDTAEQHLGRFDPWTLSNIIDQDHMRLMDDREEELTLSSLLQECEKMPDYDGKAVARAKILFNLGTCLEHLERYAEEEPVALELVAYGRRKGDSIEELRGIVLAAGAQTKLGKYVLAEESLRRSVFLIDTTEGMGRRSPWAIQQLGRLEEFLMSMGRIEEAETIKADITSRLKQYDVDTELEEIVDQAQTDY